MSFLSEGQLSTDKLVLQFVYIFTVSFSVLAGIKKAIPAKTGIGIRINSSPNRNDKNKIYNPQCWIEIYAIT